MALTLLKGLPLLILSGWGGGYFYKANGVPLWITFVFLVVYETIVTFFIFIGTKWLKKWWFFKELIQFIKQRRVNSHLLNENSVLFYPSKQFLAWLQKRKHWIVLGINFFAYVPGLGQVTIAAAQLMEIRYALPIILFNNAFRCFVLCLALYQGL
jgi:hypothetical protein